MLSPALGDMSGPRRGPKLPTTCNARKGVEADSQHKTRLRKFRRMTLVVRRFFIVCFSSFCLYILFAHSISSLINKLTPPIDTLSVAKTFCSFKRILLNKQRVFEYFITLQKNIRFSFGPLHNCTTMDQSQSRCFAV